MCWCVWVGGWVSACEREGGSVCVCVAVEGGQTRACVGALCRLVCGWGVRVWQWWERRKSDKID